MDEEDREHIDEIKENDYNISVSSYLKTNAGEVEIDIEKVNKTLEKIKKYVIIIDIKYKKQ